MVCVVLCSAAEGASGERVLPLRVQAWGSRVAADSGHAHLRRRIAQAGGRRLPQLRAQVHTAIFSLNVYLCVP